MRNILPLSTGYYPRSPFLGLRYKIRMTGNVLWENIERALKDMKMSARDVSIRAGLGVDGLRTIKQGSSPSAAKLAKIAAVLNTTPNCLLGLDEYSPPPDLPPEDAQPPRFVPIRQLDVNAGLGAGGFPDDHAPPKMFWMSADLIEWQMGGKPEDFVVMETEGQSMEPTLLNGDLVLVDQRKTNPSNPGLFALWDGFGVVIKWLERVAHSSPPMIRLISENKRFSTYEVLAEEARIVGKVVWFARKL